MLADEPQQRMPTVPDWAALLSFLRRLNGTERVHGLTTTGTSDLEVQMRHRVCGVPRSVHPTHYLTGDHSGTNLDAGPEHPGLLVIEVVMPVLPTGITGEAKTIPSCHMVERDPRDDSVLSRQKGLTHLCDDVDTGMLSRTVRTAADSSSHRKT